MTHHTDTEIDQALAATAAEYAEEDRAAAAEEEQASANSRVFSVRLAPSVYDAVREAAEHAHLTPSALIRQWVSERVGCNGRDDVADTVAALRRDVDRLTELAPPE